MEAKIVKLHVEHLRVMEIREIDSAIFGSFKTEESFRRVEEMARISVQAVTVVLDGRILFCAGFCPLWPGVFELWMIPSVYAKTAPVFFARTIRRYIDRIAIDFAAHRLQTTSFDDPFHRRWMTWLGFQPEGVLRQFTQDKRDMVQFGRIF